MHSDQDVFTYNSVCGGGELLVCKVTSNLQLHMVMMIVLLMCAQPSLICVQMARELNAEAIL